MTERDTPWPPGTPCWIDLMTPDLDASRRFYGDLFGWELTGGEPEAGGYLIANVDGKPVAGIGPAPEGVPPAWSTYLATEDAAATAKAITAAGGTLVMPPFDVMDVGVMGIATDPTGATFGIWQARSHTGVRLANVPNSLTWNEAMTPDYAAAKAFYAAVFGCTYTDLGDESFQYSTIEVDGNTVGGLGVLPADASADVPAHWNAYFAVEDTDAALDEVTRLGGTVAGPAQDSPYGRMAAVIDPQGAAFSIIAPGSPS